MGDKAASLPPPMGEEEWFEKTALTPSIATKMAYAIIAGSNKFARSRMELRDNYSYFMQLLNKTTKPSLTAQVLRWRLPVYNLSLLQLAVLCDNALVHRQLAAEYKSLWGIRLEDIDTNRHKEPNENHPLHLAYAYGRCGVVYGLKYSRELPFKKGSVTVALNPSLAPEAPVVHLDTPLHGSCLDLALQNKHMSLVLHLVPDYFKMLEGTSIVPAIECLWLAMKHVQENGQLGEVCLTFLLKYHDWNSEVNDNLFLLCCQLLNAHERKVSSKTCLTNSGILMAMFKEAVNHERLDLLTQAAKYCTQAQLHQVIRFLEGKTTSMELPTTRCEHYFSHYPDENSDVEAAVLTAFREEKKGRTLQREAMLTMLRSVEGDARRIQTDLALPETFLDFFRVPFQDLYDRLTGSSAVVS